MIDIFSRVGIALGLALLVGLQRQRTDARLAGVRTIPLVTLFGAMCALLAERFGGWALAGGLGGLAVIIVGGNLPLLRAGEERPGVTTEVTMLFMFAVGAYLMAGSAAIGIATCGAVAVLLHLKPQLHSFAARMGDRDFTAIMQFALISLVILPVLPNREFGPLEVLNPFKIWLMVVLIVGISLGGYVAYKLIGIRAGAWASGILGGLVSSTATTVSVARRSRQSAGQLHVAVFVIMMASAIVFVRVAILIGATGPQFLQAAWGPLAAMCGILAIMGFVAFRGESDGEPGMLDPGNPTELGPALLFGILYAVVLFAVAAANRFFGAQGLYAAAMISGLTDMDAITLSVAHLVSNGDIDSPTGWRLLLVAAMANLAFKAGIVAVIGEPRLIRRIGGGFGCAAACGAALIWLGPK